MQEAVAFDLTRGCVRGSMPLSPLLPEHKHPAVLGDVSPADPYPNETGKRWIESRRWWRKRKHPEWREVSHGWGKTCKFKLIGDIPFRSMMMLMMIDQHHPRRYRDKIHDIRDTRYDMLQEDNHTSYIS